MIENINHFVFLLQVFNLYRFLRYFLNKNIRNVYFMNMKYNIFIK